MRRSTRPQFRVQSEIHHHRSHTTLGGARDTLALAYLPLPSARLPTLFQIPTTALEKQTRCITFRARKSSATLLLRFRASSLPTRPHMSSASALGACALRLGSQTPTTAARAQNSQTAANLTPKRSVSVQPTQTGPRRAGRRPGTPWADGFGSVAIGPEPANPNTFSPQCPPGASQSRVLRAAYLGWAACSARHAITTF